MKPKIVFLDTGTFYNSPNIQEMISDLGEVRLFEDTPSDKIAINIADAEIVITNKVPIEEKVLQACPNIKLICVTATGVNNIDFKATEARKIEVKNARNYSTHSVAQTTFSYALYFLQNLKAYHSFTLQQYSSHPFFTHLHPGFSEINGKVWGIIGLGNIGKQVAKIAQAFGAHVIYHSPSGRNTETGFDHSPLNDLLKTADVISIHTPLNEFTKGLIGYAELNLCKKTTIFINVARGGIVNELALADQLDKGKLGGVACDVFEQEPINANNPLLAVKNKDRIILTPHIAWGSFEARKKLMEITRNNIQEYIQKCK